MIGAHLRPVVANPQRPQVLGEVVPAFQRLRHQGKIRFLTATGDTVALLLGQRCCRPRFGVLSGELSHYGVAARDAALPDGRGGRALAARSAHDSRRAGNQRLLAVRHGQASLSSKLINPNSINNITQQTV